MVCKSGEPKLVVEAQGTCSKVSSSDRSSFLQKPLQTAHNRKPLVGGGVAWWLTLSKFSGKCVIFHTPPPNRARKKEATSGDGLGLPASGFTCWCDK